MITIKNLSKIVIFVFIISCNSKKEFAESKQNNCYIIEVSQNYIPKHISRNVLQNIKTFNANSYELQLLQIRSVQGYDYKESSKIYYLKDNIFYCKDFNKETSVHYLNTDSIRLKLKTINKQHYLGVCKNSSTKRIVNEYYLKENDSITFSFILTGKGLDYFFNNNVSNELNFLQEFVKGK